MRPTSYRKKAVVIEAMRLTADNAKDVCDWIHRSSQALASVGYNQDGAILIPTLEGLMTADVGDWIIRGVKGEFYPCKPDIFEISYDLDEDVADSPRPPEDGRNWPQPHAERDA